jgi:hypothetical protein
MIKSGDPSEVEEESHGERRAITYPRDESLVETCNTSSSPNGLDGLDHRLRPVRGHLRLEHLERLTQRRDFLQIQSRQQREDERTFEATPTNCRPDRAESRMPFSKNNLHCRG